MKASKRLEEIKSSWQGAFKRQAQKGAFCCRGKKDDPEKK